MLLNRIPLLVNLLKRNMNVPSSLCVFCGAAEDEVDHVFFRCDFSSAFWRCVSRWFGDCFNVPLSRMDFKSMLKDFKGNKARCRLFRSIAYGGTWAIWIERNARLFRKERKSVLVVFDDFCLLLFNYVKDRSNCASLDWHQWCIDPNLCF